MKTEPLHIPTLPLEGLQLIEASAGTGKTWSITGLYLRWVLGIGTRALAVENILVVTFTNAAVAELRGRLRQRLREALDVLDGVARDDFVSGLMADLEPEPARKRLRLALSSMDNSAVYTIHGFCKRLLSQYAFEARLDFELDMLDNAGDTRERAVRDVWRRHVWQRTGLGELLLDHFGDAVSLEGALRELLRRQDVPLRPAVSLERALEAAARRRQLAEDLRRTWSKEGAAAVALIRDALDGRILSGVKVKRASLEKAVRDIERWLGEPRVTPRFDLFSARLMEERCNKGKAGLAPRHALFDAVDLYLDACEASQCERPAVLAEARKEILDTETNLKRSAGQLAADDLLVQARDALRTDNEGALRRALLDRFPVAMVDEFQDTDAVQYEIFQRLYGDAGDGHALLMIGDPKQAIYGFRGADVFAYFRARQDCAGRFHLGTNFRSTRALVAAVNRVFDSPAPFVLDDLEFHPAEAADAAPPLSGDPDVGALHVVLPDQQEDPGAGGRRSREAEWIAAETARLLGSGTVRLGDRPLRAGDIAVLARGHAEALAVREALASAGVSAVYRGRNSVLRGAEAEDVVLLLEALAEPENAARVRNALACTTLGLPLGALHDCIHQEDQWTATLGLFREWHLLWLRRGVLPALYALFAHFRAFEKLKASSSGERRLTDLLHICELLQHQHARGAGPRDLLRWLRRQRGSDTEPADAQKLRLETDENLVQIVTIHGSKGLQYPVVFVAGMCAAATARRGGLTWYHDRQSMLVAALDGDQDAAAAERREQLSEDLRLLYVALTRAVCRTYLLVAAGRSVAASAVGHLLRDGDDSSVEGIGRRVRQLADDTITFSSDLPAHARVPRETQAAEELAPPEPLPAVRNLWRVTSYTGLTRHLEAPGAEFLVDPEPGSRFVPAGRDIASFPRGPRAGICLHAIFERVEWLDIGARPVERICREELANAAFEEDWLPVLTRMVENVRATAFGDAASTRLADVQWALPEMEYMLPVDRIEASALDRCARLLPADLPRPSLRFQDVEGMLRGFIDLVFLHEGRFWLVDYKSNWLGPAATDYHGGALDLAVAEHRYDVQAVFYAVALHRYLRHTVRDYDANRHFGGIAYLFLRGMDGVTPGQGVWLRQPDAATLAQWDSELGAGR